MVELLVNPTVSETVESNAEEQKDVAINRDVAIEQLKLDIKELWLKTSHIMDDVRLKAVQNALFEARGYLKEQPPQLTNAFHAFYEAEREHLLASMNNQVYYTPNEKGIARVAMLTLIFSGVMLDLKMASDFYSLNLNYFLDAKLLIACLATASGGVGGGAAVLARVIESNPPRSKIVEQLHWYMVKPILGAVFGFMVYLALVLGADVLGADKLQLESIKGAIVIGFLAGFMESFPNGIFNRLIGRFGGETVSNNTIVSDKKNDVQ